MSKRKMGHGDRADDDQHAVDDIGIGYGLPEQEQDRNEDHADQAGNKRDVVVRQFRRGVNSPMQHPSTKGYECQTEYKKQPKFLLLHHPELLLSISNLLNAGRWPTRERNPPTSFPGSPSFLKIGWLSILTITLRCTRCSKTGDSQHVRKLP